MPKESAFDKYFSEVSPFSDGSLVCSASAFTAEEAACAMSEHEAGCGIFIDPAELQARLTQRWVSYCLPPEHLRHELDLNPGDSCWVVTKQRRGAKAIWSFGGSDA